MGSVSMETSILGPIPPEGPGVLMYHVAHFNPDSISSPKWSGGGPDHRVYRILMRYDSRAHKSNLFEIIFPSIRS